MLNYKLPFYGKRGSIAEILETETDYQVFRYNIDGKREKWENYIKKNYSNKEALLSDFFSNVKEWLEKNQEKYNKLQNLDILKLNSKTFLNKRNTTVILILSIIVGIMPLGSAIILDLPNIWNAGISTLIVGASFATASIIRLENIKESMECHEFIAIYNSLSHELKMYEEVKKNLHTKKDNKKSKNLKPQSYVKKQDLALKKILKQNV